MATHSSILAWEIPWTEEPGGLQSMRLQRVRHDCQSTHHGPASVHDTYTVHLKRPLGWLSRHFFFFPKIAKAVGGSEVT